jgi:NADPH:quinone reductase-like Zn-dependent oxidoreductase
VRARGLTHPIDYHDARLRGGGAPPHGGRGVDVILDPMGGASWKKGLRLLAPAGKLICFGLSAGSTGASARWCRCAHLSGGAVAYRCNPLSLMNGNRCRGRA